MTIDKLMEESRIKFPHSLSLEKTDELLDYVARNLPGMINSKTEVNEQRVNFGNDNKCHKIKGTVKITGLITDYNNYNFDSFITERSIVNSSNIIGIQFDIIPGYSLEEHGERKLEFWRDVRRQVNNYFNENNRNS